MAMARRPVLPCTVGLLSIFFVILLTGPNQPTVAQAKSPPSEILVYIFVNFTSPNQYFPLSPGSVLSSPPGFGATTVFDTDLRLTNSKEDPLVGRWAGQFNSLRDNDLVLSAVFVFNTTSYSGQVSFQYFGEFLVSGEGEITGGSGDFRFAVGYVDFDIPPQPDLANVVFSATLHLKYLV